MWRFLCTWNRWLREHKQFFTLKKIQHEKTHPRILLKHILPSTWTQRWCKSAASLVKQTVQRLQLHLMYSWPQTKSDLTALSSRLSVPMSLKWPGNIPPQRLMEPNVKLTNRWNTHNIFLCAIVVVIFYCPKWEIFPRELQVAFPEETSFKGHITQPM